MRDIIVTSDGNVYKLVKVENSESEDVCGTCDLAECYCRDPDYDLPFDALCCVLHHNRRDKHFKLVKPRGKKKARIVFA